MLIRSKSPRLTPTEMLKDEKINSIYQSFKTEDEAKDWIVKAALATLILPVDERI